MQPSIFANSLITRGEKERLGENEAGDADGISPTLNLANSHIMSRKRATG